MPTNQPRRNLEVVKAEVTQCIEIMYESNHGGVTERPNVPVLKTGDLVRGPRVQISPPPPCFLPHTGDIPDSCLGHQPCVRLCESVHVGEPFDSIF